MKNIIEYDRAIDLRIARRLKSLRSESGWSLDELAEQSGVSRATLSRLENADVSPTTSVLGRLCSAYRLTMSRLMMMVEDEFQPLLHRNEQPVWKDPEIGFRRRQVSPPATALTGEVLECEIDPGTRITYDGPARPGLEQHIVMSEGELAVTVDGRTHRLCAGDCLRFQLFGPNTFKTPVDQGAKYLIFVV